MNQGEKAGFDMYGIVRSHRRAECIEAHRDRLFIADITDREALCKVFHDADIVIHTAGYVDLGTVDREEMFRVNVEGMHSVLWAAKESRIKRIVHVSTIGIFGDTGGAVVDEHYQRQQVSFSSSYDETKLIAQQLVNEYQRQGMDAVSVLPSGIMGKGDPHFGPVIRRFLNGKLPFWAGGARITGIVHVEDVADLLLLAATRGRSGEYYIASAGELTTREMFQLLSEYSGIAPPKEVPEKWVRTLANVLTLAAKFGRFRPPLNRERIHYLYDRCVRVDASKARQTLGWNPRSPETTIKQLIP